MKNHKSNKLLLVAESEAEPRVDVWEEGAGVEAGCAPGWFPVSGRGERTCGPGGLWSPLSLVCGRKAPTLTLNITLDLTIICHQWQRFSTRSRGLFRGVAKPAAILCHKQPASKAPTRLLAGSFPCMKATNRRLWMPELVLCDIRFLA